MKKIKEILLKIYNWVYFPFLILFLIQLSLNYFKTIGFGDDSWFREILSNKEMVPSGTVIEYLKWRYETWTSRIIIEFFLVNLLQLNVIIWKVFDAAMLTVLGMAISKVFVSKKVSNNIYRKINYIIMLLLLCLPFDMFGGAGWIATFTNYLLPITMGIITLIPLRKVLCEEKIKIYEYPIYILACLIASNMEQMSAVLLVVFLIFSVYCFIIKKKNIVIPLLCIIVLCGLINIMICPGNDLRNEAEIQKCFSNFNDLNIIEKVFLGIIAMMQFCIVEFNLIYILFTGLTMFMLLKKYKNVIVRTIAIFPFIMGSAFNVLGNLISSISPDFSYIFLGGAENLITHYKGFSSPESLMILMIYVAIILTWFISLILLFGKNNRTIIAILILGAGVCSKIMLGFSPTVWASGNRTGFILILSMIITIILIFQNENEKVIDNFLNICIACGILSIFEKGVENFFIIKKLYN